jgi:hypothetical protein
VNLRENPFSWVFNCGNFLSFWKGYSWSGFDESLRSDDLRMQSVLYI